MDQRLLEKYKRMQDRFQLPHLNQLEKTFRIEITNDGKLFDQIRVEISDKLFSFTEKIIEPIIGGSDSFSCLFEQNMVSEKEREQLFELYKKVQELKWENYLLSVEPNEKKAAEWISKTWDFWNSELKEEMAEFCEKMASGWHGMKFASEKTAYHD